MISKFQTGVYTFHLLLEVVLISKFVVSLKNGNCAIIEEVKWILNIMSNKILDDRLKGLD